MNQISERILKVHKHFRKFSTERKIFRGPHAQYDFIFRKNRTAHVVRGKFSVPRKIFWSVFAPLIMLQLEL